MCSSFGSFWSHFIQNICAAERSHVFRAQLISTFKSRPITRAAQWLPMVTLGPVGSSSRIITPANSQHPTSLNSAHWASPTWHSAIPLPAWQMRLTQYNAAAPSFLYDFLRGESSSAIFSRAVLLSANRIHRTVTGFPQKLRSIWSFNLIGGFVAHYERWIPAYVIVCRLLRNDTRLALQWLPSKQSWLTTSGNV